MYDLKDSNMNGLEDISEKEMIEMQNHAQSIANMLEIALKTKKIPTGGIYWRAAKILSTTSNYLDKHEGDNAAHIRDSHGVLVDVELLNAL